MDGSVNGLRPYEEGDAERLLRLVVTAGAWPPVGVPTVEEMLRQWQRRKVQPERDICVVEDGEGKITGVMQAARFKDGTSRLGFQLAVHPDYRRKGLGAGMLRLVEERGREMGINHITCPVYVPLGQNATPGSEFLRHRGFRNDHSYWQMRMDNI